MAAVASRRRLSSGSYRSHASSIVRATPLPFAEKVFNHFALRQTVHESRWRHARIVGGLSSDKLCTVRFDPAWKVLEVKGIIEREEGTPWYQQKLVFHGRLLHDGEILAEALSASSPGSDDTSDATAPVSHSAWEPEVLLLRGADEVDSLIPATLAVA